MSPQNPQKEEGMKNPSSKSSNDWCSKSPDLAGYKSNHQTGICMDATGYGKKRDYCRYVTHHDDTFLACDIKSAGEYSYWFRSNTNQASGVPILELPYSKTQKGSKIDSYCGIASTQEAVCLSVKGAGFKSAPSVDPNPPESVRTRLITYESLLCWIPFWYPATSESVGSFISKDKNTSVEVRSNPPTQLAESYPDRRGVRIWRGLPKLIPFRLPINTLNAFSIMIKPSSKDSTDTEQTIIHTSNGPNINEFSITYIPADKKVYLKIYDGKALIGTTHTTMIQKDIWNHILFQYENGIWKSFTGTTLTKSKRMMRHTFVNRKIQLIGSSPTKNTAGFSGEIANIRCYSKPCIPLKIKAIVDDFMIYQKRETISS